MSTWASPSCILVVSVYLDDKDGPNGPTNWKLLKNLAVFLLSLDCPWLIQGDWDCSGDELADSGWLDTCVGVIFQPDSPT